MKLYIINGPNLNLLGIREPDKYGNENYDALVKKVDGYCNERSVKCVFYQSNHEGDLVDKIHEAYFDGADGIVMNPGAYTHTSIALLDALLATKIPTVEVHISKIEDREDFRQISYVRRACVATVSGLGTDGYLKGCQLLIDMKNEG